MNNKLSLILLILLPLLVQAQQNPRNIKWKKIKTAHFEVVFPENITHEGQRTANMLEFLYQPVSLTLDVKPKPSTVLLLNQSTTSNGYVRLAPRYSAWFTTPPANVGLSGSNEWLQTLSVHEFRHVVQNKKEKQKFTRLMHILFGQSGWMAGGVFIPRWYSEGDAVGIETVLTKGGRGKNPAFERAMRTNLLEGTNYNYSKAYLGSYKDYTANYYELGYYITSYLRGKYEYNIWSDIMDRYTAYSYWPFAFSRSTRKYTGLKSDKLYAETMLDLRKKWKQEINSQTFDNYEIYSPNDKKVWTNYSTPSFMNDSTFVCHKYGLDHRPTITILKKNSEKELSQINNSSYLSYNANKAIWCSPIPALWWENKNYSDIMVYDFDTDMKKRLTRKRKFNTASISKNGTKIAAIEFNETSECYLVILDAQSGEEKHKYKAEKHDFYRSPSWSADETKIVYTSTGLSGMAIHIYDTKQHSTQKINFEDEIISSPIFYNNYILYNSSHKGVENIFAIDYQTKEKYRVTNSKYGALNPQLSHNQSSMVYQEYAIKGFDVKKAPLTPDKWIKTNSIVLPDNIYHEHLIKQEKRNTIDWENEIPQKEYEVKKYNKLVKLINVHSWGIRPPAEVPENALDNSEKIALELQSENVLNTLNLKAGLEYDNFVQHWTKYIDASYTGFFPIINFRAEQTNYTFIDDLLSTDGYSYDINKTYLSPSVSIPFNFSIDEKKKFLTLDAGVDIGKRSMTNTTTKKVYSNTISSVKASVGYTEYIIPSIRAVDIQKGILAKVSYGKYIENKFNPGSIISAKLRLNFPGLFPTHALKLSCGYEKKEVLSFTSEIPFARGYNDTELLNNYSTLALDYKFPILYPDLQFGSLLYIKRIKGSFFHDMSFVFPEDDIKNMLYPDGEGKYFSSGVSLSVDYNPLNLPITLETGVVCAYRHFDKKFDFKGFAFVLYF